MGKGRGNGAHTKRSKANLHSSRLFFRRRVFQQCSLCEIEVVMHLEVDGPRAGPVPPRGLQHLAEARVQRLEAEQDERAVVDVVARPEREVGLDALHLLVQTWKTNKAIPGIGSGSSSALSDPAHPSSLGKWLLLSSCATEVNMLSFPMPEKKKRDPPFCCLLLLPFSSSVAGPKDRGKKLPRRRA